MNSIEKKLKGPIGLFILVGVLMKLFDLPYGDLIFTIAFGVYFIFKLIKIATTSRLMWTLYHSLQVLLILIAFASLIMLYLEYPYARAIFVTALLLESLVNLKIMITTYVGDENFKNILGFLGRLLRR